MSHRVLLSHLPFHCFATRLACLHAGTDPAKAANTAALLPILIEARQPRIGRLGAHCLTVPFSVSPFAK
jgi:hypothetical protein